jgi:hypothetical protein
LCITYGSPAKNNIRGNYLPVRGWDAVPWEPVPVEVVPLPVVPRFLSPAAKTVTVLAVNSNISALIMNLFIVIPSLLFQV